MSRGLIRGALVEYRGEFMGPIPNVVLFQFNPEQLARTINVPQPPIPPGSAASARSVDADQTVAPPTETFTLTAHFSAADDLGRGGAESAMPRLFGVGPQLAALEKMVYPVSAVGGAIGQAVDAVASALHIGGNSAARNIPREQVPRLLFIWGPSRVLPVRMQSLTITEQKFDGLLNPVQAEVHIGLSIITFAEGDSDKLGQGALAYSQGVKDTQAALNLAKAVELAVDIIPF